MKNRIVLGLLVITGVSLQAMDVTHLDLQAIANKAKTFASELNVNQRPEALAQQIKDVANRYVNDLPQVLVGIDLAELKQKALSTQAAQRIKENLPAVMRTLRRVNAILMNPDAAVDLFTEAYQLGRNSLNNYPAVSDFARQTTQFMDKNKESLKPLAQALSAYLTKINQAFAGANVQNMTVAEIANKFKEAVNVDQLAAEARTVYPVIATFVAQHKDDLQKLFDRVKSLDKNQLEAAFSKVQEELKKLQ